MSESSKTSTWLYPELTSSGELVWHVDQYERYAAGGMYLQFSATFTGTDSEAFAHTTYDALTYDTKLTWMAPDKSDE